jgi:hypothetical protein
MDCYSFDELVEAPWTCVSGKKYKNIITGEEVGEIISKYPTHCGKLSALMSEGMLQFLNKKCNKYTTFWGTSLPIDRNKKLFTVLQHSV